MGILTQLVVWLNLLANTLGRWLLAPIGVLPGWFSATLVAAVTGVLLLVVFKYTSAQRAIKRVRDQISANLLALKLFKESPHVAVRAQERLLLGAGRLFVLALVPTVVMAVPVTLLMGQLSLWYQHRPLRVGEEAVVTVKLNRNAGALFPTLPKNYIPTQLVVSTGPPLTRLLWCAEDFPKVTLQPTDAVETTEGPVRVFSKWEVCWNIKARKSGYRHLVFQVGDQEVDKELAVGDGFMRISARRPERVWSEDLIYYPAEEPFGPDSPVRSIDIDYPSRASLKTGTESWALCWFVGLVKASDWLGALLGLPGWLVYWFVVSLVVAFCFRRVLRVNV